MRKAKKVISFLLTLAVLATTLSGFGLIAFAANFPVDKLIEAEDGVLGEVTKVKDEGSSGGTYITVSTGARLDDPTTLSKHDLSFTFDIPSDGTYQVWMRVKILSDSNDSYHFWWDKDPFETKHPGGKGENYIWLKVAETPLKAGARTFNWCHRENGAWIDAIFVTTDASKVPKIESSSAPAASAAPTTSAAPITGAGINKDAKTFTTVDTTNVAIVSDKSASGEKAVQMTKDDRNKPDPSAKGGLEFNLVADKNGVYVVWVRLVSTSGGTDSCWMSVAGGEYKDTSLPPNSADADDYKWARIGSLGTLKAGEASN